MYFLGFNSSSRTSTKAPRTECSEEMETTEAAKQTFTPAPEMTKKYHTECSNATELISIGPQVTKGIIKAEI